MKSIPQVHDGILYRSRTEARWGEFFALAGVPFEYEPEGFDLDGEWYVPDFRVGPIYFEVKGLEPTQREAGLAKVLASATKAPVIVASGNPGACSLRAYGVDENATRCVLVEEFRQDDGAWIAEFADGGGWAFPLLGDLVNCSATGDEHPLLAVAGRLQFRKPAVANERGVMSLGGAVLNVLRDVDRKRRET